ncbi:MAG: tRNA lysidine(34) synthetase TilS, partial [Chloroflexi bacterium]|nr:tRNA lysidine(34) synthetase TilS [Chloroflexota bacterium]
MFLDQMLESIQRHRLILPGETVIAAVSGGVDSLALLHGLIRLRERLEFNLYAATLDHGLRGDESAADAAYVQQIGAAWDIPVIAGRADVLALEQQGRLNREEAARRARYTFLVQTAQQVGAAKIAVAHHQDDQAETVLMHLIRGSGSAGLGGMPLSLRLNESFCLPRATENPGEWPVLIRPLLEVSRAEIEAYAAAQGITPRHDPSNQDIAYLRNYVRHQVIPLLRERNPQVSAGLARLAELLRDDADLIRRVTENALARVLIAEHPGVLILDAKGWQPLSLAEQRHVIRAAADRVLPENHETITLAHVEGVLAAWEEGAMVKPIGAGLRAGIMGGRLVIADKRADIEHALWGDLSPSLPRGTISPTWIAGERVSWTFGAWTFSAGPITPQDDLAALHTDPLVTALHVPAGARLNLRTRQPGDRFRPRGMGGQTQKLSDTL